MNITIALAGNQNSGKTTLFNQLTGSSQHVGNFPGVTVEKKEGTLIDHPKCTVVDLPGIYSLSPYTAEEIVTRDFIIKERPAVIINIIDATNIERNLYLTLQLMTLGVPMVLALNMMDEVRSNGWTIDIAGLEKELGIYIVPLVANKKEGIPELLERVQDASVGKSPGAEHCGRLVDFCSGPVHKALHSISHIVEEASRAHGFESRFAATKIVEGDPLMEEALQLGRTDIDIISRIVKEMEHDLGTDREAAIADMRYSFIETLIGRYVVKQHESKEQLRSLRLDSVLTHTYIGIPVFVVIMCSIFWVTFGPFGSFVSDSFSGFIEIFIAFVGTLLQNMGVSEWMTSLVVSGALSGVGSVLSFLPIITILFFFLSMLEDTGYMARVAFVLDALLRKIGLSGRSFVPMLIGFGCTVPAILATRTLSSDRDRKMTILLAPFMSCSAKVPVYGVFTAAFFPNHGTLVMSILYFGGILIAVISSILFKNTLFKGNSVPFVLELPVYRLPSGKSVVIHLWGKTKDFIQRAFTIIFIGSLIIWILTSLDWSFSMVSDESKSIIASIGGFIAPVFSLNGFGNWQSVAALVSGFAAKEAVVSTLSVVLPGGLSSYFTPLSAFSFLVFTLLYTPCMAAVAATKRELQSIRWTVFALVFQSFTAWFVSAVVYQIGLLFVSLFG